MKVILYLFDKILNQIKYDRIVTFEFLLNDSLKDLNKQTRHRVIKKIKAIAFDELFSRNEFKKVTPNFIISCNGYLIIKVAKI